MADSIITSINRLYAFMLSLLIVYCHVGLGQIEHRTALKNMAALDTLVALRSLALSREPSGDEATALLLPDFYRKAAVEAYADRSDGADVFTVEALEERGFGAEPIPGANLRKSVPMRLAVGQACDVLMARGSPGDSFVFVTVQVAGGLLRVRSENAYLASFRRCGQREQFSALIFYLDNGEAAVAVPKSLLEAFPGLKISPPFHDIEFPLTKELKAHLPERISKYAPFDQEFYPIHIKAIDHFILAYAASRQGRYYQTQEFDSAVQNLFEEREKKEAFLGITASSSQILLLGPFVFFILSLELWRRVRRLPQGRFKSDTFWFGCEANDLFGRCYAYLCVFAPVLIFLIVYVTYIYANDLIIIVMGRIVSFEGLLKVQFPEAPDHTIKWIPTIISNVFGVAQLAILGRTTHHLFVIVRANLRQKMPAHDQRRPTMWQVRKLRRRK